MLGFAADRALLFLLLLGWCFAYNNGVYDSLVRCAYLSKISYCIDQIKEDRDFSVPLVLKPKGQFILSGFEADDYYGETKVQDEDIMHIAKLFYTDKDEEKLSVADISKVATPQSEGFFAIDHAGNGSIILAWRGTVNTRDYFTDINIQTVDYEPVNEAARKNFGKCDNCRVHRGFYTRFKEFKDTIFSTFTVLTETFPDYRIVITGHSMGGSFAVLTGVELSLMGLRPLIITYGSPKVSNQELSNYMDKLFFTEELFDENIMEEGTLEEGCIRVIHKGDYIPLLPIGQTFVQSGFEFLIDKDEFPHPKSSVKYLGKAKYVEHSLGFNFRDLLSFDIRKIAHWREHTEYFHLITSCEDLSKKDLAPDWAEPIAVEENEELEDGEGDGKAEDGEAEDGEADDDEEAEMEL